MLHNVTDGKKTWSKEALERKSKFNHNNEIYKIFKSINHTKQINVALEYSMDVLQELSITLYQS